MKNNVQATFRSFEAKEFDGKDPLGTVISEPTNPERVIRFRASDDTVDRYNEVIIAEGWDLEDYVKNPVVMQFHDYNLWALGKAVAVGVRDNALYIDAEFDPPEVDPSADLVYKKIRHGSVTAGSVGFIPRDYVTRGTEKGNLPENKELLDRYPNAGRIYTKQSLLEWTICPVPANPNALAASIKGCLSKRFGAETIEDAPAVSEANYGAELEVAERISNQIKTLTKG